MKLVHFKTTLLSLLLAATPAFAVSPDEENLRIVISENKFNFQFINTCVSNLSPPQEEKKDAQGNVQPPAFDGNPYFQIMKNANQFDFNGNMWYYQGEYTKASKELHDGQKLIRELFELSMEKYIVNTKAILEYAAPSIIRTKDAVAKSLVRHGFRELGFAKKSYLKGFNEAPFQHRKKIVLYTEGIIAARRARKYAILALIASRTPDEDKEEFRFINMDEYKKAIDEIRVSDYARIRNKLKTLVTNKMILQKITPMTGKDRAPVDIYEMHDDNYQLITTNRVSLLQESTHMIHPDDGAQKDTVPERPDTLPPAVPGVK